MLVFDVSGTHSSLEICHCTPFSPRNPAQTVLYFLTASVAVLPRRASPTPGVALSTQQHLHLWALVFVYLFTRAELELLEGRGYVNPCWNLPHLESACTAVVQQLMGKGGKEERKGKKRREGAWGRRKNGPVQNKTTT